MKKITILIALFAITLFSCKEKKVEKSVDDFLKVPTYESTPPAPIERIVYIDRATKEKIFAAGDSTYWYVVAVANNVNWHGTVAMGVPYFDFVEAKKQFEGAKGKLYFKFILQITKESCQSFEHYNE